MMPRSRLQGALGPRLACVALGFGVVCWAAAARADDLQQFELGKTRFEAGQYEDAALRFAAMLAPTGTPCESVPASVTTPCRLTDPDIIERARTLRAASLVALKRYDEAEAEIAAIFRQNPGFTPDPAAFPEEVIDRFTLVRGRMRTELEAEAARRAEEERKKRQDVQRAAEEEKRWIEALVKQASEQRTVVKNSRLLAAVPFGVGQFQNGSNRLGWFFAISQAVTGATSIAASIAFDYYASFDPTEADESDKIKLIRGQQASSIVNQVSFGLWAGLTVAGIVQAQIAFVPQKVIVEKRPLPPRPKKPAMRIIPTLAITPNSVGLGAVGVF
jgi:hypothetical protein